jgi:RHS repeat-associated protein
MERMDCLCAALAALVFCTAAAIADDTPPPVPEGAQSISIEAEYVQRIRASQAISGDDLFGEQINLYTGTLALRQTDVSLPGNSALPVAITREFSVTSLRYAGGHFGGWDLDLPRLSAVYAGAAGWIVGNPSSPQRFNRCSAFSAPPAAAGALGDSFFEPYEFWHGVHLHLPDGGRDEVLQRTASWQPADGHSYPLVTTSRWLLRCLPSTASGEPGEAFVALAPDGTQYQFDWLVKRRAAPVIKSYTTSPVAPGAARGSYLLDRDEHWMLPTRITDRHGNWVQYSYDSAVGADRWRLLRIEASDGRRLTLAYAGTSHRISSVSDGTRIWRYSYSPINSSLLEVQLPDASRWTFALGGLEGGVILYGTPPNCSLSHATAGTFQANQALTGSLTHPSGATVNYRLLPQHHGRSFMLPYAGNCFVYDAQNALGAARDPYVFDTWSLASRSVSGPGLITPLDWQYTYPAVQFSAQGDACGSGCPRSKTVSVTDPDGVVTRHTFGTAYQQDEGQLLRRETGTASTSLRTETFRYRQPTPGSPYPESVGFSYQDTGDAYMAARLYPQDSREISQDDVTYTWTATAFDAYAQPTAVTRSSPGHSRSETLSYHHDTTRWVLSQVASITDSSGLVPLQHSYDPVTLNPASTRHFGQPANTFTYYTNGLLRTRADGAGHTTTFNDYHRGVPRQILLADGETVSAAVDDLGQITALTDAAGFTTGYRYDGLGRLARILYPTGDSTAWQDTVLSFAFVGTNEYGLQAGHWKQTRSSGTALEETFYDALWRPVLTRRVDTANSAGTERMALQRYDSAGRAVFASYPQASISSVLATPPGITTLYDKLGRPRDITAASELGNLLTAIRYANGARTVTDPRGQSTTTTFQAFDEPDESAPVSISRPLGTLTTITRDTFGKPLSITRSGSFDGTPVSTTRRYIYDAQQRLCKVIEPESGATVLEYDSANLVAWRAAGQNLNSTTDCQRASVLTAQKTSLGYDTRQRLTSTTFGDNSPAITRSYTPDGLLEVLSTDNSSWTTQYNRRRLPSRETLQLDGSSYSLGLAYDSLGNLRERSYPDGSSIAYAPNALGEPTRVGDFATQITRHPNGALASFRYGNGITHTTTQNSRGLPARSTDAGVLDDAYAYDANANVTAITDHALNTFTRTLGYDALDRLTSAGNAGIWGGSFAFHYDPLDNLRRSSGPGQDWTWHYNTTTWRLDRLAPASGPSIAIYGYDSRGRATSRNSQTFTYDQAERLTQVGPNVASYRYDGHGRRTLITKGATRTVQVYSQAGQLLYETPADTNSDRIFIDGFEPGTGNGSKRYIYLDNHLIAEAGSNGVRYLHTDALGSPVASTNASGTITDRSYHFPYGRTVSPPQPGPGYTGHVTDTETGLSYMQARYYDPWAGRFLSTDPVAADAGSFNRYWYANNSPYKFIDPDGRWVCSDNGSGQCGKFETALGRVSNAARGDHLEPGEQRRLREIVAFYGAEGDSRVSVSYMDHGGAGGGSRLRRDGGQHITIDASRASRSNENLTLHVLARVVVHEGQHGIDDQHRGRPVATRAERRETEIASYTAQAIYQKAVNFTDSSQDGWTIYGGFSQKNIERQAQGSIEVSCGNSLEGSCQ